jgi:hypothetical protein
MEIGHSGDPDTRRTLTGMEWDSKSIFKPYAEPKHSGHGKGVLDAKQKNRCRNYLYVSAGAQRLQFQLWWKSAATAGSARGCAA